MTTSLIQLNKFLPIFIPVLFIFPFTHMSDKTDVLLNITSTKGKTKESLTLTYSNIDEYMMKLS